jgi:ABC-type sugar transport system ATPase subunit
MRSITKEFPGVKALSDVSITVAAGEVHAICGENGAGKSTLMKVLSGVYPYGTYSGEIWYRGEVVQFKDIRASEHAGIAIIHQELALIPELSITENIFLGNEIERGGVIDWAPRGCAPSTCWRAWDCATTPTRRSSISASASSSSSRSRRRSPRTSSCSSSTSRPRR